MAFKSIGLRVARTALSRFGDLFHLLGDLMFRAELHRDRFGVQLDHRKEVVEVMRDPARELSDRFHLLRMTKLFLGSS